MKKVVSLILATLLAAALFGCAAQPATDPSSAPAPVQPTATESAEAPAEVPAEEKEPITIGLIQDISGPTSVLGNQVAKGFTFAIETINAAGGMDGHPVNLVTYDYKGDIQEAVNAYNRLCSEGASIVMGPPVSNVSSALIPLTSEAKVPLLSLAGAASLYVDENGNTTPYTFLCQTNNTDYGSIMASYAINELGMKKFAFIYDQTNSYCITNAEAFKAYAESHGAEIVAEELFIGGDLDFSTQFTKAMKKSPDAIFMPNYTQNNVIAVQNRAKLGLDIPILGALDHCYPFNNVVNDPALATNIYMADNISYKDPSLEALRAPYESATGEMPTNKCYLGWDAAYIIQNAVGIAQAIDAESLTGALAQVKDLGLCTGNFTMNPDTHMPMNASMVIMKLEAGEYVELGRYTAK